MLLTVYSKQNRTGKTTFLQQVALPAICEFNALKCLYIDTLYEWRYIKRSKFLKNKITQPLSWMSQKNLLIKLLLKLYLIKYNFIILDLSYHDQYFIHTLSHLFKNHLCVAYMASKETCFVKGNIITVPDFTIVSEYIRNKQKTAVEIITEFESIESQLFSSVYAQRLFSSINQLRDILDITP